MCKWGLYKRGSTGPNAGTSCIVTMPTLYSTYVRMGTIQAGQHGAKRGHIMLSLYAHLVLILLANGDFTSGAAQGQKPANHALSPCSPCTQPTCEWGLYKWGSTGPNAGTSGLVTMLNYPSWLDKQEGMQKVGTYPSWLDKHSK